MFSRFIQLLAFQSQQPNTDIGQDTPTSTDSGSNVSFGQGILDELKQQVSPEKAMDFLELYGPKLLSAIAVFIVGRWLAKFLTRLSVRAAKKARVDETLLSFVSNLVYMLLLTAVCISALGCLGVNTTSLSAVLAAAGFAIGMALQGSLGNLASGVMLVLFKPFQVGDYVTLGGSSGTVVEIHIFNTVLLTPDNIRIIIPNGSITSGTIENYSAESRRRIDLVVGCGYNDDLRAVRRFLTELIAQDPRILVDPEPVIAVAELGDSCVNFVVRPWVQSADYWETRFDLTEKIKLGFDERGFTIPYPSHDVFVHNPGTTENAA